MNDDVPSVTQVKPGALVCNRYSSEMGVIINVNWGSVEVLLDDGVVKWAFEGFRQAYVVLQ